MLSDRIIANTLGGHVHQTSTLHMRSILYLYNF